MALASFNYFKNVNYPNFVLTLLAFQTIQYPILTVQRRLEGQSYNRAGMIPSRYMGAVHGLGLTYREEGLRGLYRGYWAYIIATAIYLAVIPLAAEISFLNTKLSGNIADDNSDVYAELLKKK